MLFWIVSYLTRYIALEKEKDYPKSIPLKIFAKDIGNCAYVSVSKPKKKLNPRSLHKTENVVDENEGRQADGLYVSYRRQAFRGTTVGVYMYL